MEAAQHKKAAAWYQRIPDSDRQMVDAVATWLAPIHWQFFVTLTFRWNVREDTAIKHLRGFISNIQRELRSRVCFVAGKERRSASTSAEVPWHFHVLLTAKVPITEDLIRSSWRSQAGPGKRTPSHPEGDSADIRPYDPERRGVEYCLKLVNNTDGDWLSAWLEYFNPNIPWSGKNSHKSVRQRRRARAEAERARKLS